MKQSKVNKAISNTFTSAIIGAGILFLTTAMPASANENVILDGKSIAELTVGWYQWQETNYPDFSFGDGEVDCSLGQNGPVWYLGGTGGGAAERTCDAPIRGHKHLMFPLINTAYTNDPGENLTVEEKRVILNEYFSDVDAFPVSACLLNVEVDGVPAVFDSAPIVRTQTPAFYWGGDAEAVADGYWAILPPLSRGEHTIHFSGGLCMEGSPLFDVDVTYNVTYQ
jgi:hypothetical protein